MALFQKAPRTPEELAQGGPLPLSPAEVDALDEDAWRARAFRGDAAPQLTARALLMGSTLGFVLALCNVYIGLKTGWGVPVALTACIVSFSLSHLLVRVRLSHARLSILETNCMQSTASSAGYATGAVMVTAIPALLVLSATPARPGGTHMPWPLLVAWTALTAVFGVCLAIPLKRSLVDRERLRFPTGFAAAELLHALYGAGREALAKARALVGAVLVAAVPPLLVDLAVRKGPDGTRAPLLPGDSAIFQWLPVPGVSAAGARFSASDWTMQLDHRLAMLGVGALVGIRVAASMLGGALLLIYVVGPWALAAGAVTTPGLAWKEIGVWVGAPMMVTAGLGAFALRAGVIVRGFRARRAAVVSDAGLPGIEVPAAWFVAGVGVAGLGIVWLGHTAFAIPWPFGLVAIALTAVLSVVACRATGETDVNPVGPMGKITQLTYGVLLPQNAVANLMTASITANAACASADLLQDLKAGRLLGAHPRRQFVAQLAGVVAGTAATVIGYHLLVPDATTLVGTAERPPAFPAPAMQQWLAVAKLMSGGLAALHPAARLGIALGAAAGVVLAILEGVAPRAAKRLPSSIGLGVGLIFPFQYPLSFFLGALGAWLFARRGAAAAERYTVPVASGLIAGESLVGVVVAAINNLR